MPGMKAIQEFAESMPILYVVIKIVLILVGTRLAVALLMHILKRVEKSRLETDRIGYKLLKKVLRAAVYIIGGITAIRQVPALSTAVTAILAGSSILAVALGFAAQESCANLISGLFISLFRPFDVGDRVQIKSQDITGSIEDITLRHTVIRTLLGTRMIVPNSVMGSAVVENVNFVDGEPTRSFIDVEISYDSDIAKAKEIMERVITGHPLYVGQKPLNIYVWRFEASGVALRGIMAARNIDESYIACSEARQQIKEEFDRNGVTIPFTTVTISNLKELVRNKSDD